MQDLSGHPKRHNWIWLQPLADDISEDEDLVRLDDEPCDIKCRHCDVVIPAAEYKAMVIKMRGETYTSPQEQFEAFVDRMEMLAAFKYDQAEQAEPEDQP